MRYLEIARLCLEYGDRKDWDGWVLRTFFVNGFHSVGQMCRWRLRSGNVVGVFSKQGRRNLISLKSE